MKYLLPLIAIAFAAPVFGQDKSPGPENPNLANWSKLGPTVEGSRGFTLHGRGIRINGKGQYELWVKITPSDQPLFVKRYDLPKNTAYVLQFATVDCEKKVLLLEKTDIRGGTDQVLEGKISAITPSSNKEAVKPGSIGESVYKFVCVDTTSLPLTNQE